jgi:hypothetical protein
LESKALFCAAPAASIVLDNGSVLVQTGFVLRASQYPIIMKKKETIYYKKKIEKCPKDKYKSKENKEIVF